VTDGLKLNYFGARYYDPEVGVWTSVDPMEQNWNDYTFCNNNAINYIDQFGLQGEEYGSAGNDAGAYAAYYSAMSSLSTTYYNSNYNYLSLSLHINYEEYSSHEEDRYAKMGGNRGLSGASTAGYGYQGGSNGGGAPSLNYGAENYGGQSGNSGNSFSATANQQTQQKDFEASNGGSEAFLTQINLATAGSFDGYAASTSRQISSIVSDRLSYKAGTNFLKANARLQVNYLRENLGFYKAACRAMTGVGIGFGVLDAAGYYSVGDYYNGGKALWQTTGGYVGGLGGAVLFSPSGPGAFAGGVGGSLFGGWFGGAAYDFLYGGNK